MTDMLESAVVWLDQIRASHLARTVSYTRDWETISILATLATTPYEVVTEEGLTLQAKAVDFIITTTDLVLAAQQTEPQRGDKIRMTVGSRVWVFQVLDLGGEGHFRPSDPFGKMLRIHTKQIGEEAV